MSLQLLNIQFVRIVTKFVIECSPTYDTSPMTANHVCRHYKMVGCPHISNLNNVSTLFLIIHG